MKITNVFVFLVLVALESMAQLQGSSSDGSGLVCEITPIEIAGLGPLLMELGLAMTVDGVKQLVLYLNASVGGVLLSPAVVGMNGLDALLNRLVVALIGRPLDLDAIVETLAVVVGKSVTCLVNLLP